MLETERLVFSRYSSLVLAGHCYYYKYRYNKASGLDRLSDWELKLKLANSLTLKWSPWNLARKWYSDKKNSNTKLVY